MLPVITPRNKWSNWNRSDTNKWLVDDTIIENLSKMSDTDMGDNLLWCWLEVHRVYLQEFELLIQQPIKLDEIKIYFKIVGTLGTWVYWWLCQNLSLCSTIDLDIRTLHWHKKIRQKITKSNDWNFKYAILLSHI
jgi:hypothetical protein